MIEIQTITNAFARIKELEEKVAKLEKKLDRIDLSVVDTIITSEDKHHTIFPRQDPYRHKK